MLFKGMEITNSSELQPGDFYSLVKAGTRTINKRDGSKKRVRQVTAEADGNDVSRDFVARVRVYRDRHGRRRVQEISRRSRY